MGKAGRWLRSFLAGKKEGKKDRPQSEAMPATALPGAIPKEKRWSFRRPVLAEKARAAETPGQGVFVEAGFGLSASEAEFDQKKHAVAVAVATAAAADAAVAAAQAAAAVVRLSSRKAHLPASLVEEAAAVRIQATFRGYLARTALCALRGIVKLQALVRGQLVRKQANATLRCMQALLTAQSQLRAQHLRFLQEHPHQPPPRPRPSPQHPRHHRSYVGSVVTAVSGGSQNGSDTTVKYGLNQEMDRSCEENAKIVEMDSGEPARRGAAAKVDRQFFVEYYGRCSPAPSAMTELSPRAYSGHFEDLSFATAHSSPQHVSAASELFPSYMANTESSRAKARSQSAPRQRTDTLERQPRRRKGPEPRSAKMQRSSSQASAAPRGGQFPWSAVKLDASLNDSECGSTSSVLTAATVYSRTRSLVGFEVRRGLY